MPTQAEKADRFKALHQGPEVLVIANPWDAGSARLLAGLGFRALSTTSAGLAFSLGRRDGTASVSRDEALANAHSIAEATSLPVAADLENGYGDNPEAAAETIHLAAETAGLVGGSIEDATGNSDRPIYDFNLAVERVAAASAAARSLSFPFMLVGRAENYLHGRAPTSTTPFVACRPMKPPERKSSTLPASPALKIFARSARPSASRSTFSSD